MLSTAERYINEEMKVHHDALAVLVEELNSIKAERFFTCAGCHKKTKIKKMSLIQEHYYTQTNTGSGSYWTASEKNVYCPKCGTRTRILRDESKAFVDEHSSFFLEKLDYYPSNRERFSIETLREEALRKKRGY